MTDIALDRDALYYPYIHIRDANWLKATLLSFPQVRRIVPRGFSLNDAPEIRPFLRATGARGEPLLSEEPANAQGAYDAQGRLLEKLAAMPPELLEKYSRNRTAPRYRSGPDSFEIHEGKMHPLLDFLESRDLAWRSRQMPARYNAAWGRHRPGEWIGVHPALGEIVMSVIAIGIAQQKGLNIVTSSGDVHRALTQLDEDAVIARLGGLKAPRPAKRDGDAAVSADELCQVVMLTSFDLSRLTADQIAELQKDGKDLRKFKTELLKIASAIPDISDPKERDARLKAAAKEVESEWAKYRKSLPRFAADALLSTANWKPPEVLATVTGGAVSGSVLTAAAGLVIGFAIYAGFGFFRAYKEKAGSPYQFLSRIEKAGAILAPKAVPLAGRRPPALPAPRQGTTVSPRLRSKAPARRN